MLKDIIHSMLYNVVLPLRKWAGEGMAGLTASLRRYTIIQHGDGRRGVALRSL
jgi:hypothetical protein